MNQNDGPYLPFEKELLKHQKLRNLYYEISKPPVVFYIPELYTKPYTPKEMTTKIQPELVTKLLTEASKYYAKNHNMYQFLENIQNAIAIEIKNAGQIEGDDLRTAAQMAILAFIKLPAYQQLLIRDKLEHPHTHEFLSESAPEWYKKNITNHHE